MKPLTLRLQRLDNAFLLALAKYGGKSHEVARLATRFNQERLTPRKTKNG